MDNTSFEVVNKHSEKGECAVIDNFKFMELVVNAKVSLQDEVFKKTDYPSTVSLLACSEKYGYFVAGHNEGFVFGQTKCLRTTFYATEEGSTSKLEDKLVVSLDHPAHQIRLSCDEQTILVALSNGTLLAYSAKDILEEKKDAQPKHSINFDTPIIDLRPNTGALPESACVLFQNKQCRLVNWKTGETIADLHGLLASAICWSPKGKRVICGRSNGTLEHYDLAGVKQDSIPPPESLQVGGGTDEKVDWKVQDVLWVDNDQFIVIYSCSHGAKSDGSINAVYIIDRKPTSDSTLKYTRLVKLPAVIDSDRPYNHFYMESMHDAAHTIIALANGASNLISIIGQDKKNGNWTTRNFPGPGMASLPLPEEDHCSTVSLGLALDFTACEKLPPPAPHDANIGVEPVPVLYCINDKGSVGAFHCYNQDWASTGTKYQHMQTAISLPSPSAFSTNPFDTALTSGYSGKGFASLEKVKGATSPIFGSSTSLSCKLNTSATPIFGSTTSIGATSTTSSFHGSSPSSPIAPPISSTSSSSSSSSSPTRKLASGNLPTKDVSSSSSTFGLSGSFESVESSDIDNGVVEHSNSTSSNSSSHSMSSFEIVNNNDITDNVPGADSSGDQQNNQSVTTKVAGGHGDLKGDDQVVPTDTTSTTTKKEKHESLATHNKTNLETPSSPTTISSHTKPMFDFGAFLNDEKKVPETHITASDTKPPLNNDTLPAKTTSPSTNTFSFGSTFEFNGDDDDDGKVNGSSMTTCIGNLGKKNVPNTNTPPFSGPSTSFGGLAKKNVPAGTASTFGENSKKFGTRGGPWVPFSDPVRKKNPPPPPTAADTSFGSRPFTFGDSTNKNVPAGGPALTFGDLGKKNALPNTAAAAPTLYESTSFTKQNVPTGTTKSMHGLKFHLLKHNTTIRDEKPPLKSKQTNVNRLPWCPVVRPTATSSKSTNIPFTTNEENKLSTTTTETKKTLSDESEDPYFKIMQVVEKMSEMQAGFQKQLQCQSNQLDNLTKNVEHLTDSIKKWQPTERGQVGATTGDSGTQVKMDSVKYQDSGVFKLNSDLTKTTQDYGDLRSEIGELECRDGDKVLAELQYRIINKKGKQEDMHGLETDTSDYSFHDFRSAVEGMEQELKQKDEEMMELKQLLTLLRFREYQRRAEYSQSTIAFEDLTDDDDDHTGFQVQEDDAKDTLTTDEKTDHATTKHKGEERSLVDKSLDRTNQ